MAEELTYRNYFCCPNDESCWDDEWSCMCNDRCPECDAEIEPYMSIDLRDGSEIVHAAEVYDKAVDLNIAQQDKLSEQFDNLN